ncbi:MAG: hypothetical protein WCV90_00820 [Candidatus Woesearchaeota archaeon]|jgi:hypothetical protein
MQLISPLENLVRSDVNLGLLGNTETKFLKVAQGPIGKSPSLGYHIGPDQGTLNFDYNPTGVDSTEPHLTAMMTFHELGYTMIKLSSGETFIVHSKNETLPKELPYQDVSSSSYVARGMELSYRLP